MSREDEFIVGEIYEQSSDNGTFIIVVERRDRQRLERDTKSLNFFKITLILLEFHISKQAEFSWVNFYEFQNQDNGFIIIIWHWEAVQCNLT